MYILIAIMIHINMMLSTKAVLFRGALRAKEQGRERSERRIRRVGREDRSSPPLSEPFYYPQVTVFEAMRQPSVRSASRFQPLHNVSVPGMPSCLRARKPPRRAIQMTTS